MNRSQVIEILEREGFQPLKSLGQNFLIEEDLCRIIREQITVPPDSYWVEVGPGLGALTRHLLTSGATLTAIELDRGLARWLEENMNDHSNFHLICGDAVDEISQLPAISLLTGNLPYNASTPLLVQTLKRSQLPAELVFTLQKETGERFCAQPGTKAYGAITVFLQSCYQVECRRTLPGEVFYPRPQVESVIFYGKQLTSPLPSKDRADFYRMLRQAFAQRRKKLRNTLGIDSDLRPENLSVPDWVRLFQQVQSNQS